MLNAFVLIEDSSGIALISFFVYIVKLSGDFCFLL